MRRRDGVPLSSREFLDDCDGIPFRYAVYRASLGMRGIDTPITTGQAHGGIVTTGTFARSSTGLWRIWGSKQTTTRRTRDGVLSPERPARGSIGFLTPVRHHLEI